MEKKKIYIIGGCRGCGATFVAAGLAFAMGRRSEGEKKGIWFYMEKRENRIWMKIVNCISPGEEFSFTTKKAKKAEHGIGTKIIDDLVKKYQGIRKTEVDTDKNMVTDRISLNGERKVWS